MRPRPHDQACPNTRNACPRADIEEVLRHLLKRPAGLDYCCFAVVSKQIEQPTNQERTRIIPATKALTPEVLTRFAIQTAQKITVRRNKEEASGRKR
jgi:hypothetical protein